MIGERRFPTKFGKLLLPEGGYGKDLRGKWWVRPPDSNMREMAQREVIEHADATITIGVSIGGREDGAGYWMLERGVWRSAEPEPQRSQESEGRAT